MKIISQEEAAKRFEQLPDDIRAVISSPDVENQVKKIASDNKLRIDKVDDFISEVVMVMLGFRKTPDFVDALAVRLGIDKEKAESLAVDVDTQVLNKIRNSLRNVQFQETSDRRFSDKTNITGESPIRDSMIKDIERSSNVTEFASSGDYNAGQFIQNEENTGGTAAYVSSRSLQDPVQPAAAAEAAPKPGETFKDKLQDKIDRTKHQVNVDPYKEPIE